MGRPRPRRQAGFTLIEILVVISIIALLVGLVAGGALLAQGAATQNRTQSMMRALLGAQEEFKSQSGFGIDLNHINNQPIDWGSGTFAQNAPGATGAASAAGLSSSERFVVACFLFDESAEALRAAAQGRGALVDSDGDGFLELRDPWENEVLYRNGNDQTGSFDGINNNLLPLNRSPFFVSAGKDGDFGTDDDITTLELGS